MKYIEHEYRTVHTGNRAHRATSPLMIELARMYGHAHGYKGELGGWIYDKDGQHIAHGWGEFFYAVKGIRTWAIEQGHIKADQEL